MAWVAIFHPVKLYFSRMKIGNAGEMGVYVMTCTITMRPQMQQIQPSQP